MPLYRGIGGLRRKDESVQYGGALLCRDGVCDDLPDGRARFVPITIASSTRAPDEFLVTTRRGKQFNSMTHSDRDALTGTHWRDAVFMAPVDAARLGLAEGAPLELVSTLGRFPVVAVRRRWPPARCRSIGPRATS